MVVVTAVAVAMAVDVAVAVAVAVVVAAAAAVVMAVVMVVVVIVVATKHMSYIPSHQPKRAGVKSWPQPPQQQHQQQQHTTTHNNTQQHTTTTTTHNCHTQQQPRPRHDHDHNHNHTRAKRQRQQQLHQPAASSPKKGPNNGGDGTEHYNTANKAGSIDLPILTINIEFCTYFAHSHAYTTGFVLSYDWRLNSSCLGHWKDVFR